MLLIIVMAVAAIGSLPSGSETPNPRQSSLNFLRLTILVILFGFSAYLLSAHRQWLDNPKLLRSEVVSWGAWGPMVYIMLYAVGPSFLVPGAVMTIAAGLAFGAWRGAVWSLLGADAGAMVAFAAGRFLGRSFVERTMGIR